MRNPACSLDVNGLKVGYTMNFVACSNNDTVMSRICIPPSLGILLESRIHTGTYHWQTTLMSSRLDLSGREANLYSDIRWFTPVVVVGGITLLILLSVVNFVQSSYVLIAEYSEDPNSTVTNGVWFKDWPSLLTNSVRPQCQPASK